jgi:hypothetical protein
MQLGRTILELLLKPLPLRISQNITVRTGEIAMVAGIEQDDLDLLTWRAIGITAIDPALLTTGAVWRLVEKINSGC